MLHADACESIRKCKGPIAVMSISLCCMPTFVLVHAVWLQLINIGYEQKERSEFAVWR